MDGFAGSLGITSKGNLLFLRGRSAASRRFGMITGIRSRRDRSTGTAIAFTGRAKAAMSRQEVKT